MQVNVLNDQFKVEVNNEFCQGTVDGPFVSLFCSSCMEIAKGYLDHHGKCYRVECRCQEPTP